MSDIEKEIAAGWIDEKLGECADEFPMICLDVTNRVARMLRDTNFMNRIILLYAACDKSEIVKDTLPEVISSLADSIFYSWLLNSENFTPETEAMYKRKIAIIIKTIGVYDPDYIEKLIGDDKDAMWEFEQTNEQMEGRMQ